MRLGWQVGHRLQVGDMHQLPSLLQVHHDALQLPMPHGVISVGCALLDCTSNACQVYSRPAQGVCQILHAYDSHLYSLFLLRLASVMCRYACPVLRMLLACETCHNKRSSTLGRSCVPILRACQGHIATHGINKHRILVRGAIEVCWHGRPRLTRKTHASIFGQGLQRDCYWNMGNFVRFSLISPVVDSACLFTDFLDEGGA